MSDPNEPAPDATTTDGTANANDTQAAGPETPAQPSAAPAEASSTQAADKPPPAELTPDIVHNALRWYASHPTDEDALATLVELRDYFARDGFAREAVAAAKAVTAHALATPEASPAVHAQMTVLLSALLPLEVARDDVDAIYVLWLRHPSSFGARPTPPEYQRDVWIQRLGDLLGWGRLKPLEDRDALARFAAWHDEWSVKNKFRSKRSLDLVRRMFPLDVWKGVHYPQQGAGPGGHGGRGEHGRPEPHAKPEGSATAAAESAPAAENTDAAKPEGSESSAPTQTGAAPDGSAGPARKKRRRKRKRGGNAGNAGTASPGAAAASNAEAPAGESAPSDGGDSGDDSEDEGDESEPNFNR